ATRWPDRADRRARRDRQARKALPDQLGRLASWPPVNLEPRGPPAKPARKVPLEPRGPGAQAPRLARSDLLAEPAPRARKAQRETEARRVPPWLARLAPQVMQVPPVNQARLVKRARPA